MAVLAPFLIIYLHIPFRPHYCSKYVHEVIQCNNGIIIYYYIIYYDIILSEYQQIPNSTYFTSGGYEEPVSFWKWTEHLVPGDSRHCNGDICICIFQSIVVGWSFGCTIGYFNIESTHHQPYFLMTFFHNFIIYWINELYEK